MKIKLAPMMYDGNFEKTSILKLRILDNHIEWTFHFFRPHIRAFHRLSSETVSLAIVSSVIVQLFSIAETMAKTS